MIKINIFFSNLNSKISNRSGFTLVELLVSISIIAILTALLTVNFVGSRQRGRDGQRKANLSNIQTALELYRSDEGTYPASLPDCGGAISVGETEYMKEIPCDPTTQNSYIYIYQDPGYILYACLENGEDSALPDSYDPNDITITGCDPEALTDKAYPYKVTNP